LFFQATRGRGGKEKKRKGGGRGEDLALIFLIELGMRRNKQSRSINNQQAQYYSLFITHNSYLLNQYT
jgi:hypothetical protein